MTLEILCQYPMSMNKRAVVRVHYDQIRELYSCCIVEGGEIQRGSTMSLTESLAAEHYQWATEAGTVYESFPGFRRV